MLQRTSKCTPAGGRGAVPKRAALAMVMTHRSQPQRLLRASCLPQIPCSPSAARGMEGGRRGHQLVLRARTTSFSARGVVGPALKLTAQHARLAQLLNSKSAARLELFARRHRSHLTESESEARLWSALKAGQLGVSFRRQVPVAGLFVADFLAPSIKLIIEVDGAIHARKQGVDARRDRKLQRAGFRVVRVVRVSAELVLSDLAAAVALVRAAL